MKVVPRDWRSIKIAIKDGSAPGYFKQNRAHSESPAGSSVTYGVEVYETLDWRTPEGITHARKIGYFTILTKADTTFNSFLTELEKGIEKIIEEVYKAEVRE